MSERLIRSLALELVAATAFILTAGNASGEPLGLPTVCESQKLSAPNPTIAGVFGASIAIDGDTAIIGAIGEDYNRGAAYVFTFDGSSWQQVQRLTPWHDPSSAFGSAVGIHQGVIVVGAPRDPCAAGIDCGAVYVFRFDGAEWVPDQRITPADASSSSNFSGFGNSVAIVGDTMIAGWETDNPESAAYIFRYNGTTWTEEQRLTVGSGFGFGFGANVSLDTDVALISGSIANVDHAYLFRFDGSSWQLERTFVGSSNIGFGGTGGAVAILGTTAVFADQWAPSPQNPNGYAGKVDVFEYDGSTWILSQSLTSENSLNDRFGYALAAAGEWLVVYTASYKAHIFRRINDSWLRIEELTPCGSLSNSGGGRVAVSDDTVMFTQTFANGAVLPSVGAAYVVPLVGCADCNTNATPDFCEVVDGAAGDCNANTVLDECDLTSPSADCNGNSVPDECDLLQGETLLSEEFTNLADSVSSGWLMMNRSEPPGPTGWFQGDTSQFESVDYVLGAGNGSGYIAANYNNTGALGTISNWLLSPVLPLRNGLRITFYTRTVWYPQWPDRLELRLSLDGAGTNVGTTAVGVGSFDTLLLTVNSELSVSEYASHWREYNIVVTGLAAPAMGRLGFRYFVTNGGSNAPNSDYIGIDAVKITGGLDQDVNGIIDSCESSEPIPAASTWGLVVLGLLICCAASTLLRRGRVRFAL